jgi:hypothetical protein
MKRELFALNDHLLKDIGLSRSEIGKLPGCLRSCPVELWLIDSPTDSRKRRALRRPTAAHPGNSRKSEEGTPRSFHLEPRPGVLVHHRPLTEKFDGAGSI